MARVSNWKGIVEKYRAEYGLGPWDAIPQAHWPDLAAACGPAELAEIEARLAELDQAAATVPTWDGDEQDRLAQARVMFQALLELAGRQDAEA